MEPGVWNGEPYDLIQTNIRVNHLALVAAARAGDGARLNMDGKNTEGVTHMENKNPAVMPETAVKDGVGDTNPPTIDADAFAAAMAEYLKNHPNPAAPTEDAANEPAAEPAATTENTENGGVTEDKPTPDEGPNHVDQGTDPTTAAVEPAAVAADPVQEITARRDAMEDGQAKADINTLLAMLEQAAARADACEAIGAASTEEKPMNKDGLSIDEQVRQRVEVLRIADKLNLDGLDGMSIRDAQAAVVKHVLPGMRLDGKGDNYLAAAYDIAKEGVNARKSVNDQRLSMFNKDGGSEKKDSPADHRNQMIARQKKED